MATIKQRITTLEQIHSEEKIVNVFVRDFSKTVPISRAVHGDLVIEKLPDESVDEFHSRAVREAQKLPCEGAVRVFDLWVGTDKPSDIADNWDR